MHVRASASSRIFHCSIPSSKFKATPPYGLAIAPNSETPSSEQSEDESVVNKTKVSVTAMQVGFEAPAASQLYVRLKLHSLFR